MVVDRLIINRSVDQGRVTESAEAALSQSEGLVMVDVQGGDEMMFSEDFACVHCNVNLGELEPRTFSFNNPHD